MRVKGLPEPTLVGYCGNCDADGEITATGACDRCGSVAVVVGAAVPPSAISLREWIEYCYPGFRL